MAKQEQNLALPPAGDHEARQQARARSMISIAALTVLCGIGLAATGDAMLGAILTLPSLVILIYALHRFGRTGPDAPIEF